MEKSRKNLKSRPAYLLSPSNDDTGRFMERRMVDALLRLFQLRTSRTNVERTLTFVPGIIERILYHLIV